MMRYFLSTRTCYRITGMALTDARQWHNVKSRQRIIRDALNEKHCNGAYEKMKIKTQ